MEDPNLLIERLDEAAQLALRENWRKVVAHAVECRDKLVARAKRGVEELLRLRDSLYIARDHGREYTDSTSDCRT